MKSQREAIKLGTQGGGKEPAAEQGTTRLFLFPVRLIISGPYHGLRWPGRRRLTMQGVEAPPHRSTDFPCRVWGRAAPGKLTKALILIARATAALLRGRGYRKVRQWRGEGAC